MRRSTEALIPRYWLLRSMNSIEVYYFRAIGRSSLATRSQQKPKSTTESLPHQNSRRTVRGAIQLGLNQWEIGSVRKGLDLAVV